MIVFSLFCNMKDKYEKKAKIKKTMSFKRQKK